MRKHAMWVLLAVAAVGLVLGGQVLSQETRPAPMSGETMRPGGGRDMPGMGAARGQGGEQFRQRAAEAMREALAVTEEQWQTLRPKIEKVQALKQDAEGTMFGRGMMGRRGRAADANDRPAPGTAPAAEESETQQKVAALRTLLDKSDAPSQEIQSALEAVRKARQKVQQDLIAARKQLRQGLQLRQEATLVMWGLLD